MDHCFLTLLSHYFSIYTEPIDPTVVLVVPTVVQVVRFLTVVLVPVPGKPISANRGLNLTNPGLKFIPRLDSVPEITIY